MSSKPRKIQLHSDHLKMWNYRGVDDFSEFAPEDVLSNDAWLCNAASDVSLESGALLIRPSDLIIALTDNPDAFSSTSIGAGDWKIIRHLKDDELAWINEQMNPYLAPSATCSGGITLEKSLQTGDYTLRVNWKTAVGTNPIISRKLFIKIGGAEFVDSGEVLANADEGYQDMSLTINTDYQFQIVVSSKEGEAISSNAISATFQYKVYTMIDVPNPIMDSAWLKAGTPVWAGTNNTPYRTITGTLTTGKHLFYCVPKACVSGLASNTPNPYLRPLYFKWDVGEGGFSVIADNILYEFPDAATEEDYVVFRTNQAGLGAISINVTSTP